MKIDKKAYGFNRGILGQSFKILFRVITEKLALQGRGIKEVPADDGRA
ncbi:MAG: hypothetical protein V6S10_04200 [Candidatus Methanoglobus sp.]